MSIRYELFNSEYVLFYINYIYILVDLLCKSNFFNLIYYVICTLIIFEYHNMTFYRSFFLLFISKILLRLLRNKNKLNEYFQFLILLG